MVNKKIVVGFCLFISLKILGMNEGNNSGLQISNAIKKKHSELTQNKMKQNSVPVVQSKDEGILYVVNFGKSFNFPNSIGNNYSNDKKIDNSSTPITTYNPDIIYFPNVAPTYENQHKYGASRGCYRERVLEKDSKSESEYLKQDSMFLYGMGKVSTVLSIEKEIEKIVSEKIEIKKFLVKQELIPYKKFKKIAYMEQQCRKEKYKSKVERLQKESEKAKKEFEIDRQNNNFSSESSRRRYIDAEVKLGLAKYELEIVRSYIKDALVEDIVKIYKYNKNFSVIEGRRIELVNEEMETRQTGLKDPKGFSELDLREQEYKIAFLKNKKEELDIDIQRGKKIRREALKSNDEVAFWEQRVAGFEADKRVFESQIKEAKEIYERKKREKKLQLQDLSDKEIEKESISKKIAIDFGENTVEVSIEEIKEISHDQIKQLTENQNYKDKISKHHEMVDVKSKTQISYDLFQCPDKEKVIEQRRISIKKVLNGEDKLRAQKHKLPKELEQVLSKKGYDLKHIQNCYGNEFQQTLNKEAIDLGGQIILQDFEGEGKDQFDALKDLALDFVYTGSCYNAIGQEIRATQCLNCGWIAKGILQGFDDKALEINQTLGKFVDQPFDTTCEMVSERALGYAYMGAFLGGVLTDMADYTACSMVAKSPFLTVASHIPIVGESIGAIQNFAKERSDEKIVNFIDTACETYKSAKNYIKETPGQELLRKGTKFTLDIVCTRQVRGFAGNFFKKASPQFLKLFKVLKEGGKISGAEGINTPIVKNIIDTTRYAQRNARKIAKKTKALAKTKDNTNKYLKRHAKKQAKKTVAKNAKKVANKSKSTTKNIAKKVDNKTRKKHHNVKGARNTLPARGRFKRVINRWTEGFSEKQALEILKKTGKEVKIKEGDFLELLKKEGFQGDSIKFSSKFFKHIFGVDCKKVEYTSGGIRTIKTGGHYLKNKFVRLKNPIERVGGFIKGKMYNVCGKGKTKEIPKSMFENLKAMEIAEKTKESFGRISEKFKYFEFDERAGKYVFYTITDCGVTLRNVMDKFGNLITSFPVEPLL